MSKMNDNKIPTTYNLKDIKKLSFRNYLQSELRRGYILENDEERYTARREKVYTFFKIPREIEKFFVYGFFQCADSFFFVVTFLPIRFILALWSLFIRPLQQFLRWRNHTKILKPAEIVDLLKGTLLLSVCYLLTYIDTSVGYHIIKSQSTIKLYLFFNMLEIADRLMSAFGQDTLDALFWTATEPRGRKREHFGVLFHLIVAVIYVGIHSCIVLLQALCLNVAINSDNKGLLTIVISNNFVELKGAVFKKFDRNNLLQISCSDVRERFHNLILLTVVVIQTMKEYSWKEERLWILMPDCALVCGTEVLIDWLKHAFITRFNDIPADAYRDYTVLLASDLVMCKQKYAYSDHSDLVARRMGFIPLPLGVVTFRILSQSLRLTNLASVVLLIAGYLCLLSFRVLNGIFILGKACDLIEAAEKRSKTRTESSSEFLEKNINKELQKISRSPSKSRSPKHESISKEPLAKISEMTLKLEESSPRRRFLETPSNLDLLQTSTASTPDTVSPSSQSLGFLGESRSGLMANSMVNLSSVGLNQGPHSPMINTGQDTGPPSPEGNIFSMESSDGQMSSKTKEEIFKYYSNVKFETKVQCTSITLPTGAPSSPIKQLNVPITKSSDSKENINLPKTDEIKERIEEILESDDVISVDTKPPTHHKNTLYSCDSIRFRGTDDDGII